MPGRKIFLSAEWRNLMMLNYAVEPGLLEPFVPAGTELDRYDGRAWLSLIGFEFNRTRVLGFAVPFHQNFEEVNVRFYIRRGEKKAVAFLSELVPRRGIAAVARLVFNEKYTRVPMAHRIESTSDGRGLKAEYAWGTGAGRCVMRLETEGESFVPEEGSAAQFISEHYWGYAAQRDGGCLEYEVRHPQWQVWKAAEAGFAGDGARYYGEAMGRVLGQPADSAFMAEGSAVTVGKGVRIL